MTKTEKRNMVLGLLFISPWIAGFILLTLYPLISSAYLSLTDYSVLSKPIYIGFDNYERILVDKLFWQSLWNTFYFAALSIPINLLSAIFLAVLLNFDLPGKKIFRTIYFLPSLVPMVCLGVLWQWMLNGQIGLVNQALWPVFDTFNALFGTTLTPPNWLADPAYAKAGLVLASMWGVGNAVVIFLAGLQDVPRALYEAAELDGCNFWQKTIHVTLPIISPVIYFNGIMSLIGSFQVFAVPYVMTNGGEGPGRSLLFTATYIFNKGFEAWSMGYACAVALILFVIILTLTLLATRLSERHVHYASK
ncbi:carbohydrate ABC transporter permease [Cerasicoccus arenae]|uniref:Spermidine/putrescine ABC transporter permease n=1 Tax=Cerasicoccus arenae TaxID=424488 RepID=A0A8J3GEU8_9BACT|nr:sugar ABC transporter permease [Cerasicoccus arenae]MBK1858034.1 sugar ABC transporter permease [Cerasicoccus arenae]GHC06640.1 spermidine/putrescine ABC transporter permease [Cerasicoccus arenae]